MRVAFGHTVAVVADDIVRRLEHEPNLEATHHLEASLLADLLTGEDPDLVQSRLELGVSALIESGAELIVTSCSSLTPGAAAPRAASGAEILAIEESSPAPLPTAAGSASLAQPAPPLRRAGARSKPPQPRQGSCRDGPNVRQRGIRGPAAGRNRRP